MIARPAAWTPASESRLDPRSPPPSRARSAAVDRAGLCADSDLADSDLAERARAGDRVAFGRLYERHRRMVHGILLARVPGREARDLVQDAFLTALRSLASLSDPARFAPWLAAIARNLAHDALRRRGAGAQSLDDDLPEPTDGAAGPDELRASAELIGQVRELPEAYRETLVLRLVEGLSGSEIAARTGMTHGSVRVNLHRGMRLLRERLAQGGWS